MGRDMKLNDLESILVFRVAVINVRLGLFSRTKLLAVEPVQYLTIPFDKVNAISVLSRVMFLCEFHFWFIIGDSLAVARLLDHDPKKQRSGPEYCAGL